MCMTSATIDSFRKQYEPWPQVDWAAPSRIEFDALKKELEELKKVIKAAAEYDARTNQPHCESEEKVAWLLKIAEVLKVDMADVMEALA